MQVQSIFQLPAIDSVDKARAIEALGIHTVRDMAEYEGCRHAAYILAFFVRGQLQDAGLEHYVEAAALTPAHLDALDALDIRHLLAVGEAGASALAVGFGISTVAQLASFAPWHQAQQIVLENVRGSFHEKPSAPEALIPRPIGSTHTQARFNGHVRENEHVFDDYALQHFSDSDEPEPASALIDIFYRGQLKFHLGYLASIHQKWINDGMHLGEVVHSLALAPGESRRVAVLDWYRRQRSERGEDTTTGERLRASFTQTRALNEVVQTTAREHLYGSTDVDATTRTTGAGAVAGSGGGASSGGAASMDLTSLIGLPVDVAGGSLGALASSIGGSLVHANGTVQGTLRSETTGERTVTGELVQDITDSTVQNASNVRSVMSTVVVEDEQRGRQSAETRSVTNHNHSHAMTVQYFEVLHRYRVDTTIDSLRPMLFLPFGPIDFSIELIQRYWYVFAKAIRRLQPGKAFAWNQVIRDFSPNNLAFDASGDLRVERVRITRTRSWSSAVRVRLDDADPSVTLAIAGTDLDASLRFEMDGDSQYIRYGVLAGEVFDVEEFFSGGGLVDSFELDEGITASLVSSFSSTLKGAMKLYLDDESRTPKVADTNRDDNELGLGSNREALIEDVDDNLYTILNNDGTVDLTLNIVYTVADRNGQTVEVPQTVHRSYGYGTLKSDNTEQVADVSAHVQGYLATVADVDPSAKMAEIESYFAFHRYGFTKYLLANLEKEQIKDIVEHLGIVGSAETLALTALIDPSPLAMTENMLVFRLREDAARLRTQIGRNYVAALRTPLVEGSVLSGHGLLQPVIRNGRGAARYRFWGQPVPAGKSGFGTADITLYVDDQPDPEGRFAVEGSVGLVQAIGARQFTHPLTLKGHATRTDGGGMRIEHRLEGPWPVGLPDVRTGTIDWDVDFPAPSGESIAAVVQRYLQGLREHEDAVRRRHRWSMVFLPSSGVFAEAILGLSNASEYLDIRRFFNWQDSPIPQAAPEIAAVNVNQDYAQPVPGTLAPTVPVSVLNQLSPMPYAMPTSLGSALQAVQNGSMFADMSKSSELTSVLGTLAELAHQTAQLSGNLAGDAAASALNAAVRLGEQVAGMIGSVMNTSVADPPKTLTQQGTAVNHLQDIQAASSGGAVSPIDQAAAGGMGTPIPGATGSPPVMEDRGTRRYIYAGADLTPERRAFNPGTHDLSGRTSFSVQVPDLPSGGSIRWSVPPASAGRFLLGRQGTDTVQSGARVEIRGIQPGLTAIDVEARDLDGRVLESVKFPLCIPQWVSIDPSPDFDALFAGYGLLPEETEALLQVAHDACDVILGDANVRLIWLMAPFADVLPAGVPPAFITSLTLLGDNLAQPGTRGATSRPAGPAIHDETISIWAGAFDDLVAGGGTDIDDVTREVVALLVAEGGVSSDDKALAIELFGRLLGSTIAHEVVHSLIGPSLSGGDHNNPPVPGDLMNAGSDTSFEERSGYVLTAPLGSAPLRDILQDKGLAAMSRPTADAAAGAYSLSDLERHFPVPPTFR